MSPNSQIHALYCPWVVCKCELCRVCWNEQHEYGIWAAWKWGLGCSVHCCVPRAFGTAPNMLWMLSKRVHEREKRRQTREGKNPKERKRRKVGWMNGRKEGRKQSLARWKCVCSTYENKRSENQTHCLEVRSCHHCWGINKRNSFNHWQVGSSVHWLALC